uniref:TSEN54 tRNA splicing endonuclease subunit n=1 Tax=Lates calcarifer TaxID=8187 RepID=A0A4W6DV26_LATCA
MKAGAGPGGRQTFSGTRVKVQFTAPPLVPPAGTSAPSLSLTWAPGSSCPAAWLLRTPLCCRELWPVGVCDVAPWRERINLRKLKMSAKEQREEDKRRRRRDVNKDKEVQRCRNWAEYQELLRRRQGRREGRPAHLWNREVTPLHDPTQPVPTDQLLDKISVIKSTDLLEGASSLKGSDEWRICFNVYQPDAVADFKKSSPGKPYSRMCVCSFDGPVPDLRAIKLLASQSGDVPVVFAVVDHGDISFYTFKDFQLPKDVYP